jgi:HSP20 family protein
MTTALAKRESRTPSTWEPLQSMRDEFEGLWSQLIGARAPAWISPAIMPALDLTENKKTVELRMDLPGFAPDEIDVQLNNNVLIVSGVREEEQKEEGATFHRVERRSGSFSRSVALPVKVADEKVDAKFRNGVLTVSMQKLENGAGRKIKVQS